MTDYDDKKHQLQVKLQQIEAAKMKTQPRELSLVIEKSCNEAQKESDQIRKQYKNNDMELEKFIEEYRKSRQKYYETEIVKQSFAAMLQQKQR